MSGVQKVLRSHPIHNHQPKTQPAAASLLLSPDPSQGGQQQPAGAGAGEMRVAVRSLLEDLARLRDFSVRACLFLIVCVCTDPHLADSRQGDKQPVLFCSVVFHRSLHHHCILFISPNPQGLELEATREVLEEEGAARDRALQGELEGIKGELGRAQVGK